MIQRTLVLLKPDAVERGLIGEIISRFKKAGLKIEAKKTLKPSKALCENHYPSTRKWLAAAGGKSLGDYKRQGLDPVKFLGTDDPLKIGKIVKGWNTEFLSSGKVVAMIISGEGAINRVREIVGPTIPAHAPPGTIRGDFSSESAIDANREKRAIRNLVHASSDVSEAKREIKLWFNEASPGTAR